MTISPIKLFLCLFYTLLFSTSSQALIIVSDIDDTLKMTNVLDGRDAVFREFMSTLAFSGMVENFKALESPSTQFVYLSGSSVFLMRETHQFFRANAFPQGQVMVRRALELGEVEKFKFEKLLGLFEKQFPTETFLLIGDDTQSDFLAYDRISQKYPDRVKGIYIHSIQGLKLPRGQNAYLNSYDLALKLFSEERISIDSLLKVRAALLNELHPEETVVAPFQICPVNYMPEFSAIASINEASFSIQNLVRKICTDRVAHLNSVE